MANRTWKGNPKLKQFLVAASDLRPDPENANEHPERNLDDIATSLETYGQQKPIVFRTGGTVIAGSGTLLAAQRLGWSHVAALQFDGKASRARGYALADNRASATSRLNPEIVGRQLRDLADVWGDGWDPSLVLFTAEEAAALPGGFGALPDEPGEGSGTSGDSRASEASEGDAPDAFREVGDDLPFDYKCPRCQHAWSGKAK